MTCCFEDAMGPSAFIHDLKLRAWDALVDSLDHLDNYICVGVREGPHYTRQSRKNDRYNQSRLNQSYSSQRQDWCHHVKEVIHDKKQMLDHIPITSTLILKE